MCNAQTGTTKTSTDSLGFNENQTNQQSVALQADTSKYALLYVYRPALLTGSLVGFNLHLTNSAVNDSVIGRAKNNSKFVVKLYQEGKTQIYAQTESKRFVNIDVKFGKKYYLKCEIAMGLFVGRPKLDLTYPEQGDLDYENVVGR